MNLLLLKSLRDIQRRPLRTLLTMVGVLLGVAGVVAISNTGHNLAAAQRETYASTRQPDLTASVANLSPAVLELIERRDNVAQADTRTVQITRMTVGAGWVTTSLIGVRDFSDMRLSSVELISGAFPRRGEVAFDITASKLAEIRLGDLVALQQNASAPVTYARVSGFVRAPATLDASILNRATAYMPASEVRQLIGQQFDNYLMVRLYEPQRASQTADEIQDLLTKRGIPSGEFVTRDPNSFTGSRELNTLLLLLTVFSYLGAVLSSFLVANTIAAVMIEETRQIGVIKALGGTRWTAMRAYLFFAACIGATGAIAGWILGLMGGRLLSSYLAGLSGLILPSFQFSTSELVMALAVGLGVTLLSASIPAWFAARQRVALLLGNVGVVADFRRGVVQRLTGNISRLGAMMAIGLRNLVRRPVRAWVTLTVVSVAVAAFLATQAVSASVNQTVDELYSLYGADGWIFFNRTLDLDFGQVLREQPGVVAAEPWGFADGSFGSDRADVWGMPQQNRIYTVRLSEGGWLRPANPTGAVLTSNLARSLNARVGDVRPLDIGRKTVQIQVLGIVDDESTYLGAATEGKVFLRIEDLQEIVGRSGRASLFALKLESSEPSRVDPLLSELEENLRHYGPSTLAMYKDQRSSRQAISILTLMLNSMVVIVGVVGLAGITNTLIINLTERRREFGILRSLGATNRHFIRLVMTEAVGLALVGCAIGILVGYPLARYLVDLTGEQLFGLTFALGPATILGTLVVALAATAAVSTGPGLIAARLRPIQVLRYE